MLCALSAQVSAFDNSKIFHFLCFMVCILINLSIAQHVLHSLDIVIAKLSISVDELLTKSVDFKGCLGRFVARILV